MFTRLPSTSNDFHPVWQLVSVGGELRGHPADCEDRKEQQLGGGDTLRVPLVPVYLCKGRLIRSNMRGCPETVHECILKCKFCCVISSCSLVTFRNVQMINVMHNNIYMGGPDALSNCLLLQKSSRYVLSPSPGHFYLLDVDMISWTRRPMTSMF